MLKKSRRKGHVAVNEWLLRKISTQMMFLPLELTISFILISNTYFYIKYIEPVYYEGLL